MRGENKIDYVRRLSALKKNTRQAEIAIGYALFQTKETPASPEDVSAYRELERQKETLAADIRAIQEMSAAQKEIQEQLGDSKKAKREYGDSLSAAQELLAQALFEGYAESLAGFFSSYREEIAVLRAKIQMAEEPEDEPEEKNVFGKIAVALRSSSKSIGIRQMEGQLARLYRKAGSAASASEDMTVLAKNNALDAAIMRAYEECRKLEGSLGAASRREEGLSAQFEANSQALKGRGGIKDLNRLMGSAAAQEDDLAAKAGKAYADTLISDGGALPQPPVEALAPLAQSVAEIRRDAALCQTDMEIFTLTAQIEAAAKLMRQGTERMRENALRIKKLAAENTELEGKIAQANDGRQKYSVQRDELLKQREIL